VSPSSPTKDLPAEIRAGSKEARARRPLRLEQLDRLLDRLDPEQFESGLEGLIVRLDGRPLECAAIAESGAKMPRLKSLPFSRSISKTYLQELEKYPLMTREVEARYARRMEFVTARLAAAEFDTEAARRRRLAEYEAVRADFVERNLYLVVSHAYAYRTYGVPLDDLVQEGNTALIRAVEKFDWRHGVRFRTYVAYWIRQAIERHLAALKGVVRVPHHLQQKFRRLKREGKLPADSEREPTVDEMARGFEIGHDAAARLLEASRPSFSIDQEVSREGDRYRDFLVENWEPRESDAELRLKNRLSRLLGDLDEREKIVLRMRFGLDGRRAATLEEVGKVLHLSRERSRQIQQRALSKLRRSAESAQLEDFL
jgi:RNA polymerase sigma factor (sigma-70 family)